MEAFAKFLVIAGITAALTGCVEDDVITSAEATNRVNIAYYQKRKQCGKDMTQVLWVPYDIMKSKLETCELALYSLACPADTIPSSCIPLIFEKVGRSSYAKL